jgi:hypothetical protein
MHGRASSIAVAAALLGLALARPAASDEARVLDAKGRVLTVGNWVTVHLDGGRSQREPSSTVLSWELRDSLEPIGRQVVAEGVVPGTTLPGGDGFADVTPSMSWNPVTHEILLAWSRQTPAGTTEIAGVRFLPADESGEWQPDTLTVLAGSDANEADPMVIHDGAGNAALIWRTMSWEQPVNLLMLTPDGQPVSRQELSRDRSVQNGAPRLGVDAYGEVFAAFIGIDRMTAEARVWVLGAAERGGGLLPMPDPVIELGVATTVGLPMALPSTGPGMPDIHLTVLGGTPVAWWTQLDASGRLVLSHVYQDPERGWDGSALRSIEITSVLDGGVPAALQLLEDRLRRIVTRFRPVTPAPIEGPLSRPLTGLRRF